MAKYEDDYEYYCKEIMKSVDVNETLQKDFYTYDEIMNADVKIDNDKKKPLREVMNYDEYKTLTDSGVVTATISENGKKCLENALKMTDKIAKKSNL